MSKGSWRRKSEVPMSQVDANWDLIFKGKSMQVRVEEKSEDIGKCGCGRSPTGKCIGWHALSEEDFKAALDKHNAESDK